MNQPENKDWLDDVLRQESPHINDDGFTDQVLAQLPRRRRRAWLSPVIVTAAAVVGGALAWSFMPDAPAMVREAVARLNQPIIFSVSLLYLVLTAGVVWFAYVTVNNEN